MSTQNGQNVRLNGKRFKKIKDSLPVKSIIPKSLSSTEKEFFDYIKFHGINEFIDSLKMIHDFALYHTDLCFDTKEKKALFDFKILWEGLEQMAKL
jgi:predicted aldo/keto reductase-like oxidoreductase